MAHGLPINIYHKLIGTISRQVRNIGKCNEMRAIASVSMDDALVSRKTCQVTLSEMYVQFILS